MTTLLTARHPSGNPNASYFTLHCTEADTSRLRYEENVGTVLDTSADREFELRIYERDDRGYCGLAGQFELARLTDAIAYLLDLASIDPAQIQNAAPLKTT